MSIIYLFVLFVWSIQCHVFSYLFYLFGLCNVMSSLFVFYLLGLLNVIYSLICLIYLVYSMSFTFLFVSFIWFIQCHVFAYLFYLFRLFDVMYSLICFIYSVPM